MKTVGQTEKASAVVSDTGELHIKDTVVRRLLGILIVLEIIRFFYD